MTRRFRIGAALALAVGMLAGCGGDDDASDGALDMGTDDAEDMEEFADAMNDAIGAGGGGSIVFGGEEIPIASAVCMLEDDTFDVGTVSDNGFRAFATLSNPQNDASAQILDADMVQWFPQDVQGDEAIRDGNTITVGPHTWFNNQDDETVEASFTVECP